MKLESIQRYHTPEAAFRALCSLFRSKEFREAAKRKGSLVNRVCEVTARYPLFTFEMSDETLERPHFPPLWRGIAKRSYDNPYISDLYYLHELLHASLLAYMPGMKFMEFGRVIGENERDASVFSEIMIYLYMPGLREKTFKNTILADFYLQNPEFMKQWENPDNRHTLYEQIRADHYQVQKGQPLKGCELNPHLEAWIDNTSWPERRSIRKFMQGFNEQNKIWLQSWKQRFDILECAVLQLMHTVDRGRNPVDAMDTYMNFLLSPEILGDKKIPFQTEAEGYSDVYWQRKITAGQSQDADKQNTLTK